MPARYAVYYAPSAGDALHQAVTPLLGRDALGGLNVPQATPPGVDPVFWKAVTRVPAHYGLHATLKAPFELRHSGMDSQLLRSTAAGFLERKKSRKTVQLLPSHDAVSLITVLPEQLQSPLLTAEWEYRLGEIERGQLAPEEFLDGISTMLKDLVGTYQVIKGTEYLFTPPREVVGKCPRCGGEVAELQKGFFCQNDSCKFAIWKNNKWWATKKKQPTKAVVSALLNDGCVRVTGLYSEKTGKTYDATVVLEDDGQYANFKLEFDQRKGGSR